MHVVYVMQQKNLILHHLKLITRV